MIRLDYYRLLPETQYIGVVDEPDADCRFTPYSVFILETRLYPLIYSMFNFYIDIVLQSQYNADKDRMDIYLVLREMKDTEDPFEVNPLIQLTQEQREIIQNKINEIGAHYPDYALIDVHELYKTSNISNSRGRESNYPLLNTKIPFSYFQQMIQYTGLDSSYNPFVRPEGIYLSFNPNSDYKPAYYEVCKFLIDRIQEFYNKGVVVLDNLVDSLEKEELIKNWDLISIDEEEIEKTIFQPNWTDERFAKNPVDFLTLKIQGDPFIRIRVSDNLVKRHGIAKALRGKAMFEGSYLKVEVKDLKEAQEVSALVTSATALTNGKVLVIATDRLSDVYLYFDYAKQKYGTESVVYRVTDGYIFSCMLPTNEKELLDDIRTEFRDFAVKRLTDVTKVSKFKNMSPHDIIEQEYLKI